MEIADAKRLKELEKENADWTVSRKQVQRIRRKEGLKVRAKAQKMPRQGISTGLPTQARYRHHVWSWDFIFDRTDTGGTLKMMTSLDEYSRQCNHPSGTEYHRGSGLNGVMAGDDHAWHIRAYPQ